MKLAIALCLCLAVAFAGQPLPLALQSKEFLTPMGRLIGEREGRYVETADTRIVGGRNANNGEFPWQIALIRSGSFTCGGVILDAKNVLTAAHCVSGVSAASLTIRYNSLRYSTGYASSAVSRVVVHSGWNSNTINNDIAILQVSGLTLGQANANPVPLAADGDDPQSGTVTVSGWGRVSGGGALAAQLLAVDIPLVSRSSCGSSWNGINTITQAMICAGQQGKGPCNGDSGGPLVRSVGGATQLTGLVSWGPSGCASSYPSVFTRIGNFRAWISQNQAA